jgi:site-specific recombinase XerD
LARRNERLRSKQLIALWHLEELIAADPKMTDAVDGWIDPALAGRLKAAGIMTIAHLVEAINGFGFRWYTQVPKVGLNAAAQIVRWLTAPGVSGALGITLHARGLTPTQKLPATVLCGTAPRTDIVALENFLMPAGLDGAHGTNRGERSLLTAYNDLSAIDAWLGKCKPGGHTRRSYCKEAERFVLWAIVEKNKPVSSLTVEDCIDYRDFLWDLGRVTPELWSTKFRVEQARCLGQRGTPPWSTFWRPFEGPLSDGSQKTALVIIQSLCQWLTDQNYLHGNPFKSVGRLARSDNRLNVTRALTNAEWKAVKTQMRKMAPDPRYYRLRFILVLAYRTGARLSELVAMKKQDLKPFTRDDEAEQHWEIRVKGKGDVTREVQLHLFAMNGIRGYFRQRGHLTFEEAPPQTPLIASLEIDPETRRADQPLSASRLYDILKGFFAEVAETLPPSQREMAERLRRASTHWLRHTFATHFLQTGGELAILRDLLGHKSLSTTSVYVTTERDTRSRAVEKFGRTAVL